MQILRVQMMTGDTPFPMKQKLVEALPMLRTFARSLTGSAEVANDLVQEAVAKALANREKFKPGTNFEAWLVTILRNHYYSELRKRRREVEDADGVYAAKQFVRAGQPDKLEMQDFLSALQILPDDQREALILIGAGGFSYQEVAEIVGAQIGTVKSRVSRARTRLDELMNGDEDLPRPTDEAMTASAEEILDVMSR